MTACGCYGEDAIWIRSNSVIRNCLLRSNWIVVCLCTGVPVKLWDTTKTARTRNTNKHSA